MEDKKIILKEFAQWVDDQIDFKELIGGFGGSVVALAKPAMAQS